MRRLILLTLLAALPLVASASPELTLFKLVDARLELMRQVAAWKYQHQRPIEDTNREKVVLDKAAEAGLRVGLVEAGSRVFFQAQIEAAKEIQRYWFSQYSKGEPPARGDDLVKVIRPKLLKLGDDITRQLGSMHGSVSELWQPAFVKEIDVVGLSLPTKLALFRGLTHVQHYPDRLTQILDTGVLRVGTTGDYAPFSLRTGSGYEGIDIDMAHDLAKALGVKLGLIATTWPTLLNDLEAGRFDVAMGGVSRNIERQKVGYLSMPYYAGGKTPIARCEDASKYASLANINRPGVHIVVNPGGTNQKYVDQHIKQANVTVYPDNKTIFDQLVSGKADVMITDAIEVKLQSRLHKSLCPAMPGKTLTYLEKGYLMPRDEPLRSFVNTWLSLEIANGSVEAKFRQFLGDPD